MYNSWVKNVHSVLTLGGIDWVDTRTALKASSAIVGVFGEQVVKSTHFYSRLCSGFYSVFFDGLNLLFGGLYLFSTEPTITRTNKIFKISNNKEVGVFIWN